MNPSNCDLRTYCGIEYIMQYHLLAGYQVSFVHPEFAHINEETLVDKYFETEEEAKDWMRKKIAYILDSMSF